MPLLPTLRFPNARTSASCRAQRCPCKDARGPGLATGCNRANRARPPTCLCRSTGACCCTRHGHRARARSSGVEFVDRFDDGRPTAALAPHLHDAVVPPRSRDGQLSFTRIVAAGFFDIDMLAGRACQNRGRGMPMVRRGDDQGVDRLIVENLAEIDDTLRATVLFCADMLHALSQRPAVDVTEISDFRVRNRGDRRRQGTAAMEAHDAHDELVVGRCRGRVVRRARHRPR